jgi:epoxyqueuosine reductase
MLVRLDLMDICRDCLTTDHGCGHWSREQIFCSKRCEYSSTTVSKYTDSMTLPLKLQVKNKCRDLDVPLVGFASADSWDKPVFEPWVPEEFRPRSIFPETETVIVIGIPVSLPVLDTSPSIFYHELYKTVNTLLDLSSYRISIMLNDLGHPSIALPRDGYGSISVLKVNPVAFFSHRHAAFLGGLGNFGVNNMILTPGYGPRVRFTSIFTSAKIPENRVMHSPLCIHCMRCVTICPVNALQEEDYPIALTDKKTCTERSEDLLKHYSSPCGFCIKVCPVGKDRDLFKRNDPEMYDESNRDFSDFHNSWKHVRSYGIK